VELVGKTVFQDGEAHRLGTLRDITARKHAEARTSTWRTTICSPACRTAPI